MDPRSCLPAGRFTGMTIHVKKIIFIVFILSTLYFILNTVPTFAQSKIFINEFLIDPQPQSVEIFNSGTESADISNWIIDDAGGTTFYTIPKNSIISPNQCLVFSADFNLNKSTADTIKLINISQQLIDSFSYKSSSGSGISYFRFPDGSSDWTTGSANLGYYNSNIGQTCLLPTLTSTPTITPSPTPEPKLTITPTKGSEDPTPTLPAAVLTEADSISYDNIYLSEVMVNPPTGEKEWVEIYNNNDFSVSLKDWHIDDIENSGSSPKMFSLEIDKKSYAVFDLSSSIFNNNGDSIRLLDFNKSTKDDLEYKLTEQGKTLGRTNFDSDDFCIQEPSKNFANNPCIDSTPTPLLPTQSGFSGLTSTKTVQTKMPIISGRETRPLQYISPISYKPPPDVLGISDELIINTPNNKPLINLLTILSASYSLLTISSILFKMKLSYGKDKNFYSSTLRPPRRK